MKRCSIEFVETKKPIAEPVTKFGGQPVWLSDPQWPPSATTGNPMRFICQIELTPDLFGEIAPKMAYVFMTDEEDGEYVDGTWESDGGENAVILQPGTPEMPVQPLMNGPSLYRMVKKMFRSKLVPQACEFGVDLTTSDDPPFADEDERANWDEATWEKYTETLDGNKIGGSPIFLQNTEFPGPGQWKLLLQLDSTNVPFYVNFGDGGVAYAFLSEDATTAKFLWQCV
jgi:uncharacterized protein YwqG